jgi:hypothetical protein
LLRNLERRIAAIPEKLPYKHMEAIRVEMAEERRHSLRNGGAVFEEFRGEGALVAEEGGQRRKIIQGHAGKTSDPQTVLRPAE